MYSLADVLFWCFVTFSVTAFVAWFWASIAKANAEVKGYTEGLHFAENAHNQAMQDLQESSMKSLRELSEQSRKNLDDLHAHHTRALRSIRV